MNSIISKYKKTLILLCSIFSLFIDAMNLEHENYKGVQYCKEMRKSHALDVREQIGKKQDCSIYQFDKDQFDKKKYLINNGFSRVDDVLELIKTIKKYRYFINIMIEEPKQEKLEKERLEQAKLKQEKLEQAKLKQEKLEKESLEKESLEKERLEKERLEQECKDQIFRENYMNFEFSPEEAKVIPIIKKMLDTTDEKTDADSVTIPKSILIPKCYDKETIPFIKGIIQLLLENKSVINIESFKKLSNNARFEVLSVFGCLNLQEKFEKKISVLPYYILSHSLDKQSSYYTRYKYNQSKNLIVSMCFNNKDFLKLTTVTHGNHECVWSLKDNCPELSFQTSLDPKEAGDIVWSIKNHKKYSDFSIEQSGRQVLYSNRQVLYNIQYRVIGIDGIGEKDPNIKTIFLVDSNSEIKAYKWILWERNKTFCDDRLLYTLKCSKKITNTENIKLCIAPNGKYMIIWYDNLIDIFNLESHERSHTIAMSRGASDQRIIEISPDSNLIALSYGRGSDYEPSVQLINYTTLPDDGKDVVLINDFDYLNRIESFDKYIEQYQERLSFLLSQKY